MPFHVANKGETVNRSRRSPQRTSVALLTVVAMATLAAACGGDDESGGAAETTVVETVAVTDPPTDPTTGPTTGDTTGAPETTVAADCGDRGDAGEIDVFLIPSPSSTAIQSFIPAFEEATCIAVNFSETPYGEAHQKQLLAYQQGDGQFDVAQFDNTFLAAFGAAEVMSPLDDYLADSPEYDVSDFSQGQLDYGKYDSDTLGLTLSTEPMIQWYRTDIYDELGLEPATTWDEYLANAQAVKAAGKGDGALMGFGPGASWWYMTLLWSFGGDLYDGDLNPMVNTPESITAVEYMQKIFEVAPEGSITATGDDVMFKFLSQDIGSIIQYSGYYGFTLTDEYNKYVGKMETAKMPMGTTDITHLAGWNIGIPADSENKDEAWQFLEFVLGKANARAYLDSGAAAIGRKSITSDAALVAEQPYLELLTIPETSRIERYPQLKVWPEMDVAITQVITAILSGQTSVEDGLNQLNDDLATILAAENG